MVFEVQFVKTRIYVMFHFRILIHGEKVINMNLKYMCIYAYINVELIKLIYQELKLNVKNYLSFIKILITGEILLLLRNLMITL